MHMFCNIYNHRCKLQWVKPLHVQVEYFCKQLREKHHHRKLLPMTTTESNRCKGQGARCKSQGQHQCKSEWDAATTCNSNHHHHRPAQDWHRRWWSAQCSNQLQVAQGQSLVRDYALVQAALGCCILLLLVPKMVLTLCNLRWWCFSCHQLAQRPHLHLQLASLATCTGGVFLVPTSTFTNVDT